MKEIFKYIFHEAPPIPQLITDDKTSMVLNTVADCGIFVFFLCFSLLCFGLAEKATPKEAYRERRATTYLIGGAMLCCAISRGLNVLAICHNFYFINGLVKAVGTILALIVILYVPYVLKAIRNVREIQKLKEVLQETSKKVDELKDISNKVLNKND